MPRMLVAGIISTATLVGIGLSTTAIKNKLTDSLGGECSAVSVSIRGPYSSFSILPAPPFPDPPSPPSVPPPAAPSEFVNIDAYCIPYGTQTANDTYLANLPAADAAGSAWSRPAPGRLRPPLLAVGLDARRHGGAVREEQAELVRAE